VLDEKECENRAGPVGNAHRPHESKQLPPGHLPRASIASRISCRLLTVTDIGAVFPVTAPSVASRDARQSRR